MDLIQTAVFLSGPVPRWLPLPNPEGFLWLLLWDRNKYMFKKKKIEMYMRVNRSSN